MVNEVTLQQKCVKRVEQLKDDRSPFMDYWGELSDYVLAHRGKYLRGDDGKNKPRRNTKQYNNTARLASRTLASGMMAGITSPARPWFSLNAADPDLNERAAVKTWLHDVEVILYRIFSQSNIYNSLHSVYKELGVYGTAAMGVFENYESVIRGKQYTIGSYMLGLGPDDQVDTFAREYKLSVAQLVKTYGIDNVSKSTRRNWETGNLYAQVDVVHLIEPNDDRDGLSPMARDMAFRSVYWEKGGDEGKFLRRSGFESFPILSPRWDIVGEDIYSEDSPGMLSLGDNKALQLGERRLYQALDKVSNPPLQGDPDLKHLLSGGAPSPGSFIAVAQGKQPLSSVYGSFQPRLDYIAAVQRETEQRIKRSFYEDLFLMLANSDRRQITAREVAEKHEEKLLMLGPVLERVHNELLDPLIDRAFERAQVAGVLPPPPPELVETDLRVEYVSVMAQAQRMVGLSGLERTVSFAAQMSNVWPESRHKINAAQVIDDYADSAGVNPEIVRSDDEVAARQQAEARAQAAAQEQATQAQDISDMQRLSQVDTSGDNALTDMMRNAGLM